MMRMAETSTALVKNCAKRGRNRQIASVTEDVLLQKGREIVYKIFWEEGTICKILINFTAPLSLKEKSEI